MAKKQDEATAAEVVDTPVVQLVSMVRDPAQYPAGPHTAQVHPDEVGNYASGGWTRV